MRDPKRYENLERMVFEGVGEYGIPTLKPVDFDGDTQSLFHSILQQQVRIEKRKAFISLLTTINL